MAKSNLRTLLSQINSSITQFINEEKRPLVELARKHGATSEEIGNVLGGLTKARISQIYPNHKKKGGEIS